MTRIDTAPSAPFHPTPARVPACSASAAHEGDTIGVVAPSYTPNRHGCCAARRRWSMRDTESSSTRRSSSCEDSRRRGRAARRESDGDVAQSRGQGRHRRTGGYGAMRMLPYLEPDVFRSNPKVVRRLLRHHRPPPLADARAQLRVFHGPTRRRPVPRAARSERTSLITALTTARPRRTRPRPRALGAARPRRRTPDRREPFAGAADDRDSYEIDTRDAILFLEETPIRCPSSTSGWCTCAPPACWPRARHRLRSALARPFRRGRVRGLSARSRVRSRRSDPDGLSAGHEVPNLTLPSARKSSSSRTTPRAGFPIGRRARVSLRRGRDSAWCSGSRPAAVSRSLPVSRPGYPLRRLARLHASSLARKLQLRARVSCYASTPPTRTPSPSFPPGL